MFNTLRVRIAVLLSLALLPIGSIAVLQTTRALTAAEQTYQSTLLAQTARMARPEADAIRGAFGLARGLAISVATLDLDPDACDRLMVQAGERDASTLFIGAVDANWQSTCNNSGQDYDFTDTEGVDRLKASPGPSVNFNPSGSVTGQAVIIVNEPIYTEAGEINGYISLSFAAQPISESREVDDLPGEVFFLTFSRDGVILTSDLPRDAVTNLLPEGRDLADLASGMRYSFTATGRDGALRIYAIVPIVAEGAYAFSSWRLPAPMTARGPSFGTVAFPFLMWAISLTVALYAIQRLVVRPVSALGRRMRSFADGRRVFQHDPMPGAPTELRDIGETFEVMATRIVHDEADLENRLHEHRVLLKEVHHRVKNNLQLMTSVLNMQARDTASSEGRMALRTMQKRLVSLATVHKGLYAGDTLSTVRADKLLRDLLPQLSNLDELSDFTEVDMALDPITLVPDQAAPLAMLATEAFTNALKHLGRFGDEPYGVRVRLKREGPDAATFEISNSLDEGAVVDNTAGLGQRLIAAFTQQLGGTQTLDTPPGRYVFAVRFPIEPFRPA